MVQQAVTANYNFHLVLSVCDETSEKETANPSGLREVPTGYGKTQGLQQFIMLILHVAESFLRS